MKRVFALILAFSATNFVYCCKGTCEDFVFTRLDNVANKLVLQNTSGTVSAENLSHLKNVTELKITGNELNGIGPGALCSITTLTSITFKNNKKIPKITKSVLKNCQHLRQLHLDGLEVEEGAFTEAPNLQTLTLNGTAISNILNGALLEGLNSLKSLTVSHAKLTEIAENAFSNLKLLEFLDLQNNEIEGIKPETFINLSELKVLNLADNKLDLTWEEFHGLKSLKVLFLERNYFDDVNVEKLVKNTPNLERIFLSYDKLLPGAIQKIDGTLPRLNINVIYTGKKFE